MDRAVTVASVGVATDRLAHMVASESSPEFAECAANAICAIAC